MKVTPEPARGPGGAELRRVASAWRLAASCAPQVLCGYTLLTLAAAVLPVMTAYLTKLVLDHLAGGAGLRGLLVLGGALAVAGVVAGVLPQATQYLRTELDRAVGLSVQDRLFTAVGGFVGLRRFEDPAFLNRLRMAQQSGGTSPCSNQVLDSTLGVVKGVVTVAGFLGTLAVLNPAMTVVVVLSGLPMLAAEIALSRRRAEMFWNIGPAERREFFYVNLLSRVEAATEVRLFGTSGFLRGRMLAERCTANAARRSVDRREVRVQTGLSLLAAVVSGGGLLWAVYTARTGELSLGSVAMFLAAVMGVQSALGALAANFARAHQALLVFEHYLGVIDVGPDLAVAPHPCPLPVLRSGIEFRDVWFRYSDAHPWTLRGVDLFIPFGQAVALVGLNGAGKSTLVKLICRLYDPTRGAVLWDGVDLRDTDVEELRGRIGAVFQDYMKYDLTAAENIGLGDLDSLDDNSRISAAARRAGIHDTLQCLPMRYDTLLSRSFAETSAGQPSTAGVMLSGGQWQRLALARALLRDERDLLILDEPSAGLDAAAEHEIHASLAAHRAGRTSLLISHRLGAARGADTIVVLADGRIVERGDHRELMELDGEYARLFTLQASGYSTASER